MTKSYPFTYDRGVYLFRPTQYEPDIPFRRAGWFWHPASKSECRRAQMGQPCKACELGLSKVWYTTDAARAATLIEHATAQARAALASYVEALRESSAADADISIPHPPRRVPFGYQKAGVAAMLKRRASLLADAMGVGKSYQAVLFANCKPEVRRIVIVAPKTLGSNWEREVHAGLVRDKFRVYFGMPPAEDYLEPFTHVLILGLEQCRDPEIAEAAKAFLRGAPSLLIVDEIHRARNARAQLTHAILGDVRQADPRKQGGIQEAATYLLLLSGTPIVNGRAAEMWPALRTCDPVTWNSWPHYFRRYCGGKPTGASNLEELAAKARASCMVRRLKKDVLTDLPPKIRQVVPIINDELATLVDREQQILKGVIPEDEAAAEEYIARVRTVRDIGSVDITEMSALRRDMAIAKVPLVVEFVEELLDSTDKVAIYAHHQEVIRKLTSALSRYGAVSISGTTPPNKRQGVVDTFQTDPSCRVFIGSITAAGVGITLTAASTAVFAELDWVPGKIDQAEDRCVTLDSMILTKSGPKAAEHVVPGDEVYTHTGNYRRVQAAFTHNYTGGFVTIESKRGRTPLRVTYGHPVYAIQKDADTPKWVAAEDVRVGDYLIVPRPTYTRSCPAPVSLLDAIGHLPVQSQGAGHRGMNGRLQMRDFVLGDKLVDLADDRFLYLLGWFVAEGYIQFGSKGEKTPGAWKSVGWALNAKDEAHIGNRISEIVYDLFGVRAKQYTNRQGSTLDVRVSATLLARLFGTLCGIGAANVRFPEWALRLPLDKMRIAFEGYMDGDGHRAGNTRSCVTINPALAYQVREMALAFGFSPAVRVVKRENVHDQYIVDYTETPSRPIETHPGFMLRRVTRTTHEFVDRLKVANFKVAVDESYLCDDVTVHNCHRIGQRSTVHVIHLVADRSLDARMALRLIEKQRLNDAATQGKDLGALGEPAEENERSGSELADRLHTALVHAGDAPAVAAPPTRPAVPEEDKAFVQQIARQLLGVCDGACRQDMAGYSRFDREFGEAIATRPALTDKMAVAGAKLLWKYRRQIGSAAADRLLAIHTAAQA